MTEVDRDLSPAREGYRVTVLGVPNSVSAYCIGVEGLR
ncbi:hypothetical protein FHS07_002853 [Microbacterium proteolyticum]|uniref:Uncharacterized protein n=1 Tax=Microbacterium proteolyticum TaxID=1572644 RepID=A0A7W5CL14_9MICO|nr:hypothetical protein [Microbacterium proteolyticum]